MDLISHSTEEQLRREAAADRLRELADELSRNNGITFVQGNIQHTVKVPDEVTLVFEVEVGEDGSEIEFEIKW